MYGFKFEFNLTTLSRSSFITYHPPKKKIVYHSGYESETVKLNLIIEIIE